MRKLALAVVLVGLAALPIAAQRGGTTGPAAFAVFVSDPSGAPITDVKVTVTGRAEKSGMTEGGRIAFEELPVGKYHFTFEKDGYDPVEQDVTGRRGAPVDVKVTMTPAPKPVPPPPLPTPEPRPAVNAHVVVLDMPAFIEKNYVGKSSGQTTPMACGDGGSATLVQANDSIAEHTHADADEFIYVIAGEIEFELEGVRTVTLGSRDCLYYDPTARHRWRDVGNVEPWVLVVSNQEH